jgi:hypothetical protein
VRALRPGSPPSLASSSAMRAFNALVEAIAGQLMPNSVALYRSAERLEGVPYGSPPSHDRAGPRGATGAKSPFISVVACLGRWSLPLGRAAAYQHMVPS